MIPFEVRLESRRDVRFSLTARKAFCRLPHRTPAADLGGHVAAFETWLAEATAARPDLLAAHTPVSVASGQIWRLGPYAFRIALSGTTARSGSAQIVGDADEYGVRALALALPTGTSPRTAHALAEKLLYRVAGRLAKAGVEALVAAENEAHFGVDVGRVRLSPTRSRWGSCSSSGTLSLSTRLLAAPAACLRAVVVHELAHYREMNHSPRFWGLVYAAMPDYAAAERWLETEGKYAGWAIDARG